jgi:hypothetical protein
MPAAPAPTIATSVSAAIAIRPHAGSETAPAVIAKKERREIASMVTGGFALPPHYPEKASFCKRLMSATVTPA